MYTPDQCSDLHRLFVQLSLQALTFMLFTAILITVYMPASASLALVINVFKPESLIMDITTSQEGNYILGNGWEHLAFTSESQTVVRDSE